MLEEEREFPAFLAGLTAGLYRALLTDPDVFLLFLGGGLLGSGRRRRGMGAATLLYVTFRRLDQYMDVFTHLAQLSQVMAEPSTNNHQHDRSPHP